jgi:PBSX family phage terminase large subunit
MEYVDTTEIEENEGLPYGAPYSDDIVLAFNPLPRQKEFMFDVLWNPEARFIWYCGGFGSGKTFIGSHVAVRLAMENPKGRGLIGRHTLVDLKATTMKTFFEVCDQRLIWKWNKSENLLTLINGHEIYFWGLDDIEKLKSLEIGWFWFDEVDEVGVEAFKVAQGRLRNKNQKKRVGFITSNSEGKNWTYKLFVKGVTGDGQLTEEELERYYLIKAPSNENIHLPADYLEILNSYKGDLYERYVKASFNVFEGQIYPDFNAAFHVVRPFAIPADWEKIRCMDWGENNPTTCMWLAIDPEGNIWLYREYVKRREYTPYHVKEIKRMSAGEKYLYTVMDPSVKGRRGRSGKNIDAEYKEMGMPLQMGANAVNAGIARMHRYLNIDPERIHPITKQKGAPRFFVFDTCPVFLEEIETYKFKKKKNDDENPLEEPVKKDDHCLDAVRYGIMSRPDVSFGSVHSNSKLKPPAKPKNIEEELLKNALRNHPDDF